MKSRLPRTTTLVLTLVGCLIGSESLAQRHGVLVVAKSLEDLTTVSQVLPSALTQRVAVTGTGILGPMLNAVTDKSQLGFWLDWEAGRPLTTGFVIDPDLRGFRNSLKQQNVETEKIEGGVTRVALPVPMFFKVKEGVFFFAYSAEELLLAKKPFRGSPDWLERPLAMKLELDRIPNETKESLASILAVRLLPDSASADSGFSPEYLMKELVRRYCKDALVNTKTLTVELEAQEDDLRIALDLVQEGATVRKHYRSTRSAKLTAPESANFLLDFHTTLDKNESLELSWWANSLPQQVEYSLQSSEIQDRHGESVLLSLARLASKQVQRMAVSEELGGFFALVGESEKSPTALLGIKLPSSDWTSEALLKFLRTEEVSELGIVGIEPNYQTIGNINLHRLTLGEQGQALETATLGLGDNCLFLAEGEAGLQALESHLASSNDGLERSAPVTLKIPDFDIGGVFGWRGDENLDAQMNLEVKSEYRSSGARFELSFTR